MFKKFTSKKFEVFALFTILTITLLVYLNHFDNPFFFDDAHTISTNQSIRNLDKWTTFFTNADTFSSLPANRSYRPMITLMNAIDYAIAGGLKSNIFHYHIFFWYLILIILVYFLIKHLYIKSTNKFRRIEVAAIFATSWFALHTANAETINYICARSDSFSTLCVVASLLLYIHPTTRKWYLYLFTMILGIWTKQTGVIFFPILFIYIVLFEEYSIIDEFKTKTKEKILIILKKIAPTAIISTSIFLFNQFYLTPKLTVSTNHFVTKFEYISTQCYVMIHYLGNFFLPLKLSADPDIAIIKPWYDIRILFGVLVISGMIFLMIKTALKRKLRPISFGIAWFFIALLPTTLNPLFQIANDHRMFFPFIGLFLCVTWAIVLLISEYKLLEKGNNYASSITLIAAVLLLTAHAYGTIKRNEVWNSQESLWFDVSIKSPKNGRGLMNYGEIQMRKGNYDIALKYFTKANELIPNYNILYINLGVLYAAQNNHIKANQYYKAAINLNTSSPAPEYHYGKYLYEQKKYKEAKIYINKALTKSSNHIKSKQLLEKISTKIISVEKDIEAFKKANTDLSVEYYLSLSHKYYQNQQFALVISTCKELLKIDPKNSAAYNNICSSYNQLGQWKLGAEACKKALKIDPNYQLAKNNLKWSTDNIKN